MKILLYIALGGALDVVAEPPEVFFQAHRGGLEEVPREATGRGVRRGASSLPRVPRPSPRVPASLRDNLAGVDAGASAA